MFVMILLGNHRNRESSMNKNKFTHFDFRNHNSGNIDLVTLNIDNRPVASAELGRHFERLAVRVLDIFEAHPFSNAPGSGPTQS